jgi:hypothetical protein
MPSTADSWRLVHIFSPHSYIQERLVSEGSIIAITQFRITITPNCPELKRSGPEIQLSRPWDKQNVEPPCK